MSKREICLIKRNYDLITGFNCYGYHLLKKARISGRSEKRDKGIHILTFLRKLISSALSNAITTLFPQCMNKLLHSHFEGN